MKSSLPFLVFLITISAQSSAQYSDQSVISAAGDISKSANLILEWTLGELATETVSSKDNMYTQGF
ncbi:MAG: hypothetical protein M3040_05235, partial [Bacteroidota bacterium]|nr:hypothetical protein [Bacteroidota bacterium]